MCIEIEVEYIDDDGLLATRICETKGQLEAALGGSVLPNDPEWEDHVCLCPLDIEATARKFGYAVVKDDDPMLVKFAMAWTGEWRQLYTIRQ